MVRGGCVRGLGGQSTAVFPAAAPRGLAAAAVAPARSLLAVISLYTIPVAARLLWSWRGNRRHRDASVRAGHGSLCGRRLVVAITHVYETVFLLRDWESDRLRSARLEQARLQTELESLGREVDPHFLFNNLNALAHLIEQRSEVAPWFIRP